MRLLNGTILIRVTAEEKRKKLITESNGIQFLNAIEVAEDMGEAFAQTVSSAEVIAVAGDVKHIMVGDIAIIDYATELLPDKLVYRDNRGKILRLEVFTTYHDDDKYIYPSEKTRNVMKVWENGEVDMPSLVYGVFRDDQLIPNPPYIFLEHKDFQISSIAENGMVYQKFEEGARIRRVLIPNEFSDAELQPGTLIVVEDFCLYEREFEGKLFDVIMDQDIEMSFD